MASHGGHANCKVATTDTAIGILCKWLEVQDLGEKDLDGIVEGQPPTATPSTETATTCGRP